MSAPALQVQFDPASARFGASRSQKRLEDDRLLLGKGLFSDDRVFPREAWMVLVRSSHAHARISSIDLSECRKHRGVLAAWSMAELRADGVRHIPFPPLFKRADGSPMAAPLRTPLDCSERGCAGSWRISASSLSMSKSTTVKNTGSGTSWVSLIEWDARLQTC